MGNISIVDIQNTLSNRLRDLQLRQNLAPLRHTLTRAMTGGAKAVSTGRSRLIRGMDALWNEFERGMNDESSPRRSSADTVNSNASGQTRSMVDQKRRWSSIAETPSTAKSASNNASLERPKTPTSSLESSTQQAGRLFSSFSSFLSRKQKEISQVMEETMAPVQNNDTVHTPISNPRSPVSRTASSGATSDDDSSSAFVDVGAMFPFSTNSTTAATNNNNSNVSNTTKDIQQQQADKNDLEKKKEDGGVLNI
ncbi:hypothetical protein BDA99DRAFT_491415 [Phascolomyces articulosus]|uniref:Uncharacterized protein n=1 Tax=Phascolomyces articulosus TaxID=60185 RepID=A0AAD5KQD0_9FUNG|nr:hypothetical protein BDA99DRAFT_491415 [Phascolomyces articulosus]